MPPAKNPKNLDEIFSDGRAIDAAVRRAVKKALAAQRRPARPAKPRKRPRPRAA